MKGRMQMYFRKIWSQTQCLVDSRIGKHTLFMILIQSIQLVVSFSERAICEGEFRIQSD
jgi:hypothetical protein